MSNDYNSINKILINYLIKVKTVKSENNPAIGVKL